MIAIFASKIHALCVEQLAHSGLLAVIFAVISRMVKTNPINQADAARP